MNIKRTVIILCFLYPFSHSSILLSRNGNPDNWCRSGHFPAEINSEKTGIIKIQKLNEKRSYFYSDDDSCPDKTARCRKKSYLIEGDEILISHEYKNFICAWYTSNKGRHSEGWLLKSHVKFKKTSVPDINDWIGTWVYYKNEIIIKKSENNKLHTTGNAVWQTEYTVHVGEFDITETPVKNTVTNSIQDEYDCAVRMHLIGKRLVVSDNKNCGGMNVSFDGVYIRKK